MAYHEQQHRKRLSLAQANNALILLIAINMIIFVVLAFLYAVFHLRYENAAEARHFYETKILSQFALPADFSKIAAKPWTILTHMFTHESVWHLLGNMLWLWVFGYIFLDLTGNRKIIPLYIYGAIELALAVRNSAGDNVAHFAHLGGAITGFIIVYIWNKTNRKTLY